MQGIPGPRTVCLDQCGHCPKLAFEYLFKVS